MTQPLPQLPPLPPNMQALVTQVLADNPMHRNFMQLSLARLTADEMAQLEDYLAYCVQRGLTIPYLSESYLVIVSDTLQEQIYFRKHRKYRYSTFAEVADKVYFNREYMSHYMYGLAITSFLWPNHLDLHRFFDAVLPRNKPGAYLEIGPGHGYFLMHAMKHSTFTHFTGVDISETSIALTQSLVEHSHGPDKRLELKLMDFLNCHLAESSFDAVVMGEVLEHVERPELFLKKIAYVAKKDAFIYVTTCINAPAVDHIYLFGNAEQLEKMFLECGLRIKKQLIRPYEGKTVEESIAELLPINVAYSLEKL